MALVVWSGGCDSTLVLWQLLQEQSKSSPCVNTIAITHPSCGGQSEQLAARNKMLASLRKRGYRINHTEVSISEGCKWMDGNIPQQALPQAAIWLGLVVPYMGLNDDLYLGYVKGDCIWSYWREYQWAFEYLCKICGRDGKLKVPLCNWPKDGVIDALKDAKLLNLVWYCEEPTSNRKPCGRCLSCITHKLGIYRGKLVRGEVK